jgi:hypothetical protein
MGILGGFQNPIFRGLKNGDFGHFWSLFSTIHFLPLKMNKTGFFALF